MKKITVMLLVCFFVFNVISVSVFADGNYQGASDWAVPELDKAEKDGLISQTVSEDMSADITREEFAEIIVLLYEKYTGLKAEMPSISFSDTNNEWVLEAAGLGLMQGNDDDKFNPKDYITREQLATVLFRAMKILNSNLDFTVTNSIKFLDESMIEDWAKEGVYFAANYGIVQGYDGQFDPDGKSSREAAVIIVNRTYEGLNGNKFKTVDDKTVEDLRAIANAAGMPEDLPIIEGGYNGSRASNVSNDGSGGFMYTIPSSQYEFAAKTYANYVKEKYSVKLLDKLPPESFVWGVGGERGKMGIGITLTKSGDTVGVVVGYGNLDYNHEKDEQNQKIEIPKGLPSDLPYPDIMRDARAIETAVNSGIQFETDYDGGDMSISTTAKMYRDYLNKLPGFMEEKSEDEYKMMALKDEKILNITIKPGTTDTRITVVILFVRPPA